PVGAPVLFLDFGGTLVDSLRDPYPVYRSVLSSFGIDLDRPHFDEAWRRLPVENAATAHAFLGRTDEYWRGWDLRALQALGVSDPMGEITHALRRGFLDPKWYEPFPESAEVLRELRRRGYRLHVVSNQTE